MSLSRRAFIAASALAAVSSRAAAAGSPAARIQTQPRNNTFDPWLEIDASALAHNAGTLSRLTGNRPILAVAKNNAYGCGLETAGPILARLDSVWGLAVVRPDEARALRKAGIRKPILLMGAAANDEAEELVRNDVRLAPYTHNDSAQLVELARRVGRPIGVHLYVDTGMHRMGMPHDRVLPWLDLPGVRDAIRIEGAFTELTEDQDFDRQQSARLRALAEGARAKGLSLGRLHAASSDAIQRPTQEAFLDLIRPGLALYGGYVSADALSRAELRPAYRMKARVLRIDRLEPGDGVSYQRRYIAGKPEWTATLAVGHVDGYPSGAARGCEILIRDRLFPVIGTVSASHTIVALGAETNVQVGDEATLVGGDRPALHPNVIAQRSGWSEYNMFMHLNPALARRARD